MKTGAVRIGISGWRYKGWRGVFYPKELPQRRELEYAGSNFPSVEINGTFYSLQRPESFEAWAAATPDEFVFAVKGPRFITHMKKLRDCETPLANFFASGVLRLGSKLGPILFQLPPRWNVNPERLDSFLSMLPKQRRYVFELRNATWHTDAIYGILRAHNAAFCIYELAGFHSPIELTADWTYVRLHGPGGKYQGSYSDKLLRAWADRIAAWSEQLRSIYVYFDNDQAGYAAFNALTLKKMVEQKVGARSAA